MVASEPGPPSMDGYFDLIEAILKRLTIEGRIQWVETYLPMTSALAFSRAFPGTDRQNGQRWRKGTVSRDSAQPI